jgi:hypothetical protein
MCGLGMERGIVMRRTMIMTMSWSWRSRRRGIKKKRRRKTQGTKKTQGLQLLELLLPLNLDLTLMRRRLATKLRTNTTPSTAEKMLFELFKIPWPRRGHIRVVVALRVSIWIPRFIDVLGTRVVVRSCPNLRYFKFTYLIIFRLDFFICERCESIPSDSDAKNDDHKWWHSLLVLRKTLIEPVLEAASNNVETIGTQVETQAAAADSDLLSTDDASTGTNPHSALISAVEDTFHVALTAMEGKVDSTRVAIEGQLSSTTMNLEERVVKLDEKITELTKMNLEERVIKLDEKITTLTKMNLEERVVKLDEKISELTKMLGGLIGQLNT